MVLMAIAYNMQREEQKSLEIKGKVLPLYAWDQTLSFPA